MIVDIFLFFYCTAVFLSFSIFLFDGYLLFCLIWIFSIFYSTSSGLAVLPDFARLIWFLFFSSMLLGRFLYSQFFRRKSFQPLKDYHALIITPNSNYNIPRYLSIKPIIFKYFVFAYLVILILGLTGVGQNPEFAGSVNAGSKSRLPYVIEGLITALLSYWKYSILFASRYIASSSYSVFLNKILPFSVTTSFVGVFKYSTYLASYATKFISPLVEYISLRYYAKFSWFSIKRSLLGLRFNAKLIAFSLLMLAVFMASYFILMSLGVELLNLLVMKILNRSDSYGLLNTDSIAMLSDEYAGNLFYFFHPFLKLFGSQAYDMPMGSFLISKGSNLNQIGGPNVHLPVVLFVLGGAGGLGYSFLIVSGILFSFLLCHARKCIHSYMYSHSHHLTIFWPIFYFTLFPLLLQEPSAFGHQLFFAALIYYFLRFLKPTLYYIFSAFSGDF